jgi:hypothetical protein
MTNEQINIAIAEACGWTDCSNIDGTLCGLPIGVTSLKGRYDIIPDYCNDLNAMHEAENILDYDNLREMEKNILFIFAVIPLRATAAQHAKAFLKTIGKWEGAK